MKPIVALVAFFALSGCATSLQKEVEKAGYTAYSPIRSNWGPGFLFTGSMPSPTPACRNLFGDELAFDDLENATLYFEDITLSTANSFDLSLNFLKELVGPENSADLQLAEVKNSDTVTITWGPVREFAYFLEDGFTAEGARPITDACLQALRKLKKDNQLGTVNMITRAVAVKDLTYEIKTVMTGGGGLNVKIANALDVKLGKGKWNYDRDGKLRITTPVFLGYAKPMKLKDFVDTNEVSAMPRVKLIVE